MADDVADYFRVIEDEAGWRFEVATVAWPMPHKPVLEWQTFRRWRRQPDAAEIARAREAALATPSLFRRCATCGTLQNAGHMHNARMCQSCAERVLGIIH